MFAILIIPVFALFYRAACRFHGRRASLLIALIGWGVTVVAITETASLCNAITRGGLALGWIAACTVAFVIERSCRKSRRREAEKPFEWTPWSKAMATGSALIIGTLLLLALVAPPNTWDAMTYHMSRVMHWMQNRNVSHYPTNILRQIHLNPGAEFIILHFQVLCGSDRLANLPQWLAMFGCVIGVSLIAKQLGATSSGQLFAAVVCATIPMGILQATGAQNDYVAALWLVCTTWLVLVMRERSPGTKWDCLFGAAVAMAILTKATCFIFGAPIVLWYLVVGFRQRQFPGMLIAAMLVAVVNFGHWSRNYRAFGSILGPPDEVVTYRNDAMGPGRLASNVLRNLAIHANLGSKRIDLATERAVTWLHQLMGLNASDRATTITGEMFEVPIKWNHEDYAGNGADLILFVVAVVGLALRGMKRDERAWWGVAAIVVAGFLGFCLYLRWQPWHSRLQLPLFVLMAPVIGVAASRLLSERAMGMLGLVLLAVAMPWLLRNYSRPMVGEKNLFSVSRYEAMFFSFPEAREAVDSVVSQVRQRPCHRLGLMLTADAWEYPYWATLNGGGVGPYWIDHIHVNNASRDLHGGIHKDANERECVTPIQTPPKEGARP